MENIIRFDAEEHFLPQFAVVAYASESETYQSTHYFLYHKIIGECLSAGMPLTRDTARNIFQCLKGDLNKFSFKGMLPKNLVHFDFKGNLRLIWFVHPKQHNLFFDSKTGISIGLYPMPKLLFFLEGNSLRVFALKRKDSLNDRTKLYHAPFFNISSGGGVCMGTATLDYDGFDFYEDVMGFVEKQFFSSMFTATHHNKLIKGNLVAYMQNIEGQQKFDDSVLVSNKLTLNQLYEK